MKSKFVITYYTFVLSLLLVKVVAVIFQGSLVLYQSHQVATLEEQRRGFEQQQLLLSQQLAATRSLATISNSPLLIEFEPMGKPLTVITTVGTPVAVTNL